MRVDPSMSLIRDATVPIGSLAISATYETACYLWSRVSLLAAGHGPKNSRATRSCPTVLDAIRVEP